MIRARYSHQGDSRSRNSRNCRLSNRRLGFSMIEVMVACGILGTVLSVLASLAYRNQRTWQMLHERQVAQDELFSLGQQAQQTSRDQMPSIESLTLSSHAIDSLAEANLQIKVGDDDLGTHVRFDLNWQRIGDPPPIHYTVWIPASETDS